MEVIRDATMFINVQGSLRPHPHVPASSEVDVYSLCAARGRALGWSSSVVVGSPPGLAQDLWGMNDAGEDWTGTATPGQLCWWQIGLADQFGTTKPIPVQPMAACVRDVLARVGDLDLAAVEFLLPVYLAGDATFHIMSTRTWFDPALTGPTRPLLLTLTVGGDDFTGIPAEAFRTHVRELLDGSAVEIGGQVTGEHATSAVPPAFDHDMWVGTGRRQLSFEITAEWDLDAAGWIALVSSEAARRVGVDRPVLVTLRTP